ncbi:MAG: hypothetical protein COT35_11145 [Nitrospirae bacterium CG08_land_8_20_14_0_20_52_24]|nr:MAG: hypothetical protein COT35_11145 [Nitrospirae bacterium CG08_land_8_20_14_0_20_52_24]PIV85248.1 MAG: hypothetical protein COW52_03230 [Nitrospirae bacterium CG17_big_fil_post_rev_8_21_14_2_50_50_9]
MKIKTTLTLLVLMIFPGWVFAYPPAVGILGKAKDCSSCHINNGPWRDDGKTIIDILDKETKRSFKQLDGGFLIEVKRGEPKTVLTVIGLSTEGEKEAPYRNAWLYVDPKTIESSSLSKFAPGWDVDLPMACRIVGDKLEGFDGAKITVLPMTIRPTDAAQDAEVILLVMLTKGESVKGKPREGLIGNYFERKVKLKVKD